MYPTGMLSYFFSFQILCVDPIAWEYLNYKGAFIRNEIQPDIPTIYFGPFIGPNGWLFYNIL